MISNKYLCRLHRVTSSDSLARLANNARPRAVFIKGARSAIHAPQLIMYRDRNGMTTEKERQRKEICTFTYVNEGDGKKSGRRATSAFSLAVIRSSRLAQECSILSSGGSAASYQYA